MCGFFLLWHVRLEGRAVVLNGAAVVKYKQMYSIPNVNYHKSSIVIIIVVIIIIDIIIDIIIIFIIDIIIIIINAISIIFVITLPLNAALMPEVSMHTPYNHY